MSVHVCVRDRERGGGYECKLNLCLRKIVSYPYIKIFKFPFCIELTYSFMPFVHLTLARWYEAGRVPCFAESRALVLLWELVETGQSNKDHSTKAAMTREPQCSAPWGLASTG